MTKIESLERAIKLEAQLLESIRERKETETDIGELRDTHEEYLKSEISLNMKTIELQKAKIAMGAKNREQLLEIMKLAQEVTKEKEKELKLYKQSTKDADNFAKKLGQILGVSKKWQDSFTGSLMKALNNPQQMLSSLRKEVFNLSAITSSFIGAVEKSTVELAFTQDKALSAFNRTSLAGGKYNDVIRDLEKTNFDAGISTESLVSSADNLRNSVSDFSTMSTEASRELVEMTSHLSRMGVSSDLTAKNVQFLTKSLGMTGKEATKSLGRLTKLATELQMAPAAIFDQFGKAQSQLALFGKNAQEVFEDLSETFKKTGIEVSRLISITEGFRNLEGAATVAGRLNAILGGPLVSSMKLLKTSFESPQKALDYLTGSLDKAEISFENLEAPMKQALAKVIGFGSVDEMSRMLNKNSAELELNKQNLEKYGFTTEQMQEMNKQNVDVMEQLNFLMRSFAVEVLIPLIEPLKKIIKFLTDMNKEHKSLIFGVLGLVVAFKVLTALLKFTGIAGALFKIGGAAGTAGSGAAMATKPLMGLAGVILAIGVAVGIAAYGISLMADSFAKLNPQQISGLQDTLMGLGAGLFVFTVAMLGLAKIAPLASLGLIKIGAGLIVLSVGVAITAYGVKILADAFVTLFESVVNRSGELSSIALGILEISGSVIALAAAFTLAGTASLMMGFGAIGLAASIAAIGVALQLVSTKDLQAIGQMMSGLGEISTGEGGNFDKAATMVTRVVQVVDDSDVEKVMTTTKLLSEIKAIQKITVAQEKETEALGTPEEQKKQPLIANIYIGEDLIETVVVDAVNKNYK